MSTPTRKGMFLAALTLALPLAVALAAPAYSDPGGGNSTTAAANGPDHSDGNRGTSGDPDQPQPPSKGDFSGHGANKHGAYDSTRDGSPSGNGNGGGEAVGKPCAGCVGKADNKNPPGQAPDGSDPNAGYECDRNHGIGRSNPAHTGCRSSTTPPTTPPSSPPDGENPPPGGGGGGGAAPGDLPVTGTPLGTILGTALALLLGGVLLTWLSRPATAGVFRRSRTDR